MLIMMPNGWEPVEFKIEELHSKELLIEIPCIGIIGMTKARILFPEIN